MALDRLFNGRVMRVARKRMAIRNRAAKKNELARFTKKMLAIMRVSVALLCTRRTCPRNSVAGGSTSKGEAAGLVHTGAMNCQVSSVSASR